MRTHQPRKLHFIGYRDGGLKTSQLSCLLCMEEGGVCKDCDDKPFTLTPAAIHKALGVEARDNDDGDEATEEDNYDTTHPGMIVGEPIPDLDNEDASESEFDEDEGPRLLKKVILSGLQLDVAGFRPR